MPYRINSLKMVSRSLPFQHDRFEARKRSYTEPEGREILGAETVVKMQGWESEAARPPQYPILRPLKISKNMMAGNVVFSSLYRTKANHAIMLKPLISVCLSFALAHSFSPD